MKTLTVAAVLIALAASAFAAGEAPKGFRALVWGSKAPQSLTKVTGPTSDGTSLYAPANNTKLQPILDLPVAEEAYSFTNGKFYSGTAWLDSRENFEKAKQYLLEAYGKPEFANESLEIYKWKWPGSKIEVHLSYQKKFSRTALTYINNAI
jgi:hypothetical protein